MVSSDKPLRQAVNPNQNKLSFMDDAKVTKMIISKGEKCVSVMASNPSRELAQVATWYLDLHYLQVQDAMQGILHQTKTPHHKH